MNTIITGRGMRLLAAVLLTACVLAPDAVEAERVLLSLEKAVELGLENDEALRQAKEAVDGAKAEVTQARSNALPHLTLSGQYGRNILKPAFFLPEEFREEPDSPAKVEIGEDNEFFGQATVTQVLWAAGRVSAGLVAAREFLASYRMQEKVVADFVRFSVKEAYFTALLSDRALEIEKRAMIETEEAARIARVGFDQGTVSRFDLMRAEVELANRRAPLAKARNDLEQALSVLSRRCGLDADTELELADSLELIERPESLEGLLSVMREKSAEIKGLEHYIAARKQFLRIAKAERYPMLQMSAYYGIQTQWSEGFTPPSELIANVAAVQVGLQIPIFDGFNAKGKINKAAAELRSAELDLERLSRDRELAVRQSWLALENALAALEGRREAVGLAEEAYRLALIRLQNGLATPLERLDAEFAMSVSRVQLAESLFSYRISLALLELSVGSDGYSVIDKVDVE
jgi:outer membrane protein